MSASCNVPGSPRNSRASGTEDRRCGCKRFCRDRFVPSAVTGCGRKALRSGCSEFRRHVVEAHGMKTRRPSSEIHEADLSASQMRRRFRACVWNTGSQVGRRAADDASALPTSPSAAPGIRKDRASWPAPRRTAARSRSRSRPGRRRSGASSICLSVNGRTSVRVRARSRRCSRLRAAMARPARVRSRRVAATPMPCSRDPFALRDVDGLLPCTRPAVDDRRSTGNGLRLHGQCRPVAPESSRADARETQSSPSFRQTQAHRRPRKARRRFRRSSRAPV